MIANATKDMTAYEVAQRQQEKLTALGPVISIDSRTKAQASPSSGACRSWPARAGQQSETVSPRGDGILLNSRSQRGTCARATMVGSFRTLETICRTSSVTLHSCSDTYCVPGTEQGSPLEAKVTHLAQAWPPNDEEIAMKTDRAAALERLPAPVFCGVFCPEKPSLIALVRAHFGCGSSSTIWGRVGAFDATQARSNPLARTLPSLDLTR
jgi:hypothetical protein